MLGDACLDEDLLKNIRSTVGRRLPRVFSRITSDVAPGTKQNCGVKARKSPSNTPFATKEMR